jgi:uncharacterized protein (TIGR03437 family)
MLLRYPKGLVPVPQIFRLSVRQTCEHFRLGPVSTIAAILTCCAVAATAQSPDAPRQSATLRPLTLNRTSYRLRAGESTRVEAPPETLDFLLRAKTRRVEIAGEQKRGIAIAPNRAKDQILVAVSLAIKPGDYTLTLSATAEAGEKRIAPLSITVDALEPVPSNATQPPVILLNGWQAPGLDSSCPPSTAADTFDNLSNYLTQYDSIPVVYFSDNCTVCPNCSIEELGGDLAQSIDSIQYDNGTPVPQVDLIAHSMGGLIVRSYLSGKQTSSGVFSPPLNPKVRKAIFIATPHFGSYQADSALADILFFAGSQTNEMKPGSQFLWDLATWNQSGDDLRGTDALAIIGNAESGGQGDGVVSLTSASLRFAEPDVRTRLVSYCHIDFDALLGTLGATALGCTAPGIAYIDSTAHPTYQIVQSFLANTTSWQNSAESTTPSQNPYLSANGGLLLANKNASNQYYNVLTSVDATNANLTLTPGPGNSVASLFYNEWVPALTYDLAVWNGSTKTLTGTLTVGAGGGEATYFKQGPLITSVQSSPVSSVPGRVVQSGGLITIGGAGFGAQQCSGCQVLAAPPGTGSGSVLKVASWTNQAISAYFLPANMPNLAVPGLVTIYVELSSTVWDSINIMAAPPSSIAVAPSTLQFAYMAGGTIPASQSIQITNSDGVALNWGATTTASWLSVASASGAAPYALSVLVSPAVLGVGTYTGSVQVSSAGASDSPVSVSVTLTVAPPPAALAVSPQTLTFNYAAGGPVPAPQGISITNGGGGTLSWTASSGAAWLVLSPVSGTAPATLSVSVNPGTLTAGQYSGTIQITAAGALDSPQAISIALIVTAPTIASVVNGASFQPGIESGSWVTIQGADLATDSRTWQTSDFNGNNLPLSLDGTSVTIDGKPAAVYYISATQLNVQAPTDATTGAVPVVVTNNGQVSAAFMAQLQTYAPAFFLYTGTEYAIAQHYPDNALVGNPSLVSGTVAAKPGDVLILWGTGFGPTNPPTPAGVVVSGAPGGSTLPAVTVGGVPVTVISAVLSPGSAGLYQVAIQLPASVPTGAVAIQASVGGVPSPGNIVIFVSAD